MPIAREGIREIVLATLILGALAAIGVSLAWLAAIPFVIVWVWVISFFRDPFRHASFAVGELCAPADGRVTEITELAHHDAMNGPAVRVGIFLSIFDVHINRMPCAGRVRSLAYRPGTFLDARHPDSGRRNESNTLLIDPDPPMAGPIEVRQVAGMIARRIICHAGANDHFERGARFGMIKFGSRTELTIPLDENTEIRVKVGDKVRAGVTIMACQPVAVAGPKSDAELQAAST